MRNSAAMCSSMIQSCRKIVAQYREESRQLDDNPRLWGDEGRTLKQVGAAPAEGLQKQLCTLQCVVNPGPRCLVAAQNTVPSILSLNAGAGHGGR